MKKKIKIAVEMAAIFMVIATMTSEIHATAASSAGMGISQENAWAVEGQLPYLYTNPAEAGVFGPMVFGETTGAANTANGGILFQPIPMLNIGVFAGQNVDRTEFTNVYSNPNAATAFALTPFNGLTTLTPAPTTILSPNSLTNQNASVIVQANLGTLSVGAGFTYGAVSQKYTNDNVATATTVSEKLSLSESSINAVAGVLLTLDKMKIDVSGAYRTAGVDNQYDYSNTANTVKGTFSLKDKGAGDILLDAQAIFDLGSSIVHVMGGYDLLNGSSQANGSVTSGTTITTTSDSQTINGSNIKAGISDEMKISKEIMAFVGVAFKLNSTTKTTPVGTTTVTGITPTANDLQSVTKSSTMTLPVFFGMEANLSESWQARFGLQANILNIPDLSTKTTQTQPTASAQNVTNGSNSWDNATPTFSTGISFKTASRFAFDWDISIPLLTIGPNFIGGGAPNLATAFAVSYKFGEKTEK